MMESEQLKEILKQWKKEARINEGIHLQYENGCLKIFTTKPGIMIGYHGELVNKYKEILKQRILDFDSIEFIESKYYIE